MKKTNQSTLLALAFATAAMAACGGGGGAGGPDAVTPSGEKVVTGTGETVTKAAANKFAVGLKQLQAHDKKSDWTDATCNATAEAFKEANNKQKGTFYEALYNAGVAYQRCKNDAEAKKVFQDILSKKPEFHRARVHVALYKFEQDKDIESAISEMKQAISDAKYLNEEALVNLAMLQMQRDGSTGDNNCDNDFECAKLNLQRALAINDSFMPAFNQLAVYYFESAKKKAGRGRGRRNVRSAGGKRVKADSAALELAALVVSQALRKNPGYAPVHNTSGLISAELDDLSTAAKSFGKASQLDPKFFEAHMNYAAVNLQFHGFRRAEAAYRKALKLSPNDYEANLGLALAVRGQINNDNWDKNVKEALSLLHKAKSIDSSRPETYYNEGILVEEFKAKRMAGAKAEPVMEQAKSLYKQFIQKAGSGAVFKDAIKRSEERMKEIDQKIAWNRKTRAEQAKMEADLKRYQAEELKRKQREKMKGKK